MLESGNGEFCVWNSQDMMRHVPPTADATHFALRNASLASLREELCEIMCQRKDFKAVDKPEKERTAEATIAPDSRFDHPTWSIGWLAN